MLEVAPISIHEGLPLWIQEWPALYPNARTNITPVVENILAIDGGFVVDIIDSSTKVIIEGNQFHAFFPIVVSSKEYIIIITWNTKLVEKKWINWRRHPFSKIHYWTYAVGELTRWDVATNNMSFMLLEPHNNKLLNTNDAFWLEFRNRIPANHPLSLIPQY